MNPRLRTRSAGLLALAALAGCGTAPVASKAAKEAAVIATPAAAARPAGPTPAQLGAALAKIAITNGDLHNGYQMRLMPDGDQVTGQVTLDNCGYRFSTEAHRVARRQYDMVTAAAALTGLSNELVAYDTPAEAAKALAEWHTSAQTCPHTPTRAPVAGVPDMTVRVTSDALNTSFLPVRTNAVTIEQTTVAGHSETLFSVAAIQVHGRYLDAIYLNASQPITADGIRDTLLTAALTGRRLAALR